MPYKTGSWGDQAKTRAKTRNEYFRLYKKTRDPIKVKARYLVDLARKSNTLVKLPCSICGGTNHIEAHHEDYSKPLEVIWLCPKHHREADRELGLRK